MPESTSNKETAKKIIISIVSTVAAALIIFYFIDSKKPNQERKQATLRAWNSYMQNRKIFQNTMSEMSKPMMAGEGDLVKGQNNALNEVDITISNLENIKTQNNVDDRLFSLVDITVSQIKEINSHFKEVFQTLTQLANSNLSETEMQNQASRITTEFATNINDIKNRDKIRVNTFKEALCKEYGGDICD